MVYTVKRLPSSLLKKKSQMKKQYLGLDQMIQFEMWDYLLPMDNLQKVLHCDQSVSGELSI